MKPVIFKEHNRVYGKDQKEYIPLPALIKDGEEGEVITCWSLSFKERVRLLFTGVIWMSLWSFRKPLTPSRLTTKKSEVI